MTIMNIVVASGKGGTGKTFFSTNLFYSFRKMGILSSLVDCDAEAPNSFIFFSVKKIKEEVILKRAKLRALHLLNDMDRTESQLRTKLKQGLYPEDIVEQAIAYVKSFGYIGDASYARRYITSRQKSKSKKEIYAELCRKGVARDEIDAAMEECYEDIDETAAIKEILRKKRFDIQKATDLEKQKLYGYLARKGFSYDGIRQVIQVSDWNA